MLSHTKLLLLAAGAAVATAAAPAHAMSTQTVGPQSFSVTGANASTTAITFTGFNSTLGTLTAVKLSNSTGGAGWTATFGGILQVGQFDSNPRNASIAGTPGFFFSNGSALSGSSGSVTLTPSQVSSSGLTNLTGSGNYTNTLVSTIAVNTPALQAYFANSPTISASTALWSPTTDTGLGVFGNTLTLSSSQLYLTYQYTPNVVPGPLPILGAGAAFGFSRKLRKRIRTSAA